tara:strand:+ start:121 stop:489 length:369 start_codon:yes stop_codon:yes gene_type:complete
MAIVTLNFNHDITDSNVKVGDVIYYIFYTNLSSSGGFTIDGNIDNVVKFGTVSSLPLPNIVNVNVTENVSPPGKHDYVFFSRDNQVQQRDLIGYFASVKLVNDSTDYAELFQVSLGAVESSK